MSRKITSALIGTLILPVVAWATECVMQDRTVSDAVVVVQERSNIQREVVPAPDGGRRCIVNFKARVGNTWHWATGQYDWPGDRPREEACAVAMKRAEDSLRNLVRPAHVASQQVLICNDGSDMATLKNSQIGSMAKLDQFRPHPDFPNAFWHKGTHCRWFLESSFKNNDIYTYQGVICRVESERWVVVDKF
jgi:hypothetical protein